MRPRRSKEALNLAKRWIQIAAIRIRLCSVSVVVVVTKDEKAKRKEKQNRSGKFEHRSGSAEEIFEEFWNCGILTVLLNPTIWNSGTRIAVVLSFFIQTCLPVAQTRQADPYHPTQASLA